MDIKKKTRKTQVTNHLLVESVPMVTMQIRRGD